MVTPPGKVPRPRWMTSPSWAASSAFWTDEAQPCPAPTHASEAAANGADQAIAPDTTLRVPASVSVRRILLAPVTRCWRRVDMGTLLVKKSCAETTDRTERAAREPGGGHAFCHVENRG